MMRETAKQSTSFLGQGKEMHRIPKLPPDVVATVDRQMWELREKVNEALPGLKDNLRAGCSPEFVTAHYTSTVQEALSFMIENEELCVCDIAKLTAYLMTRIARLEMEAGK